jgi:hypothetical protein
MMDVSRASAQSPSQHRAGEFEEFFMKNATPLRSMAP